MFADLFDGALAVVANAKSELPKEINWELVVVIPNGAPVGAEMAKLLMKKPKAIRIDKKLNDMGLIESLNISIPDLISTNHIIVCDDGVETGTAALGIAKKLESMGAKHLVLIAPVIPRELEPRLLGSYKQLISASRPIARRALKWEYRDFSPLTLEAATELLGLER